MNEIRKKYEELFPETNWSDEMIIANMFCNTGINEDKSNNYDIVFETNDEAYEYLKQIKATPIEKTIDELVHYNLL